MKAQAVAQAAVRGLERVSPDSDVIVSPLESGGSGTTDLAVLYAHGRVHHEVVPIPRHRPRDVKWAWLEDNTAIFDAQGVLGRPDGPALLPAVYTDSRPLGEMLIRLVSHRPRRIVIALADVLAADGGLGLLSAFGVRPVSSVGPVAEAGARRLLGLDAVDISHLAPPPVPIVVLVDQWTTWNDRVKQQDFRLDLVHGGLTEASRQYAQLLAEHVGVPVAAVAGSGAGGGLGLALAFLGAKFVSGATFLAELGGLAAKAGRADWVLTGSPVLTGLSCVQTVGVAASAAREAGIPAVALTLELGRGHAALYDAGLVGLYSVLDRPRSHKETQRTLSALVEKAAYRVGYWMQALSDP
jgi:glycerate kinase